jgi:hypothetical protein
MTLCNVASAVSVQLKLAQQGSVGALIDALKDTEEIVTRYACMALTNLSTNVDNQVCAV